MTLGLSPNDAEHGNCKCDACQAADAKFGSAAGTLLDFVNRVAVAVQAELPDRKIWVETLAYQYTQKAPTPGTIAPASNVLLCLAPIYSPPRGSSSFAFGLNTLFKLSPTPAMFGLSSK